PGGGCQSAMDAARGGWQCRAMRLPFRIFGLSAFASAPVLTLALAVALTFALPGTARAHSAEQAFVLLLPTEVYTWAGVGAVALTVLVAGLWPFAGPAGRAMSPASAIPFRHAEGAAVQTVRAAALAVLGGLIFVGLYGPRDPLSNLLPLSVWSLWWIAFPVLQGIAGDLWRWVMPWTTLSWPEERRALIALPGWLGQWPAVLGFLGFNAFLLADPAPNDPWRLAAFVMIYAAFTFAAVALTGPGWLMRGEFATAILGWYARLAPGLRHLPGGRLAGVLPSISGAVLVLSILGSGSFDGLKETFFWLGLQGVNPLEFPGRSAVVVPTLAGLVLANLLLVGAFALAVWLGLRLAGMRGMLREAFCRLSLAMLPIALGYHIAHYLSAAIVESQYLLLAMSDPLGRRADLLGLGGFQVTTGMFNRLDTVEILWLIQAGAVVIGHVWSVLLGHAIALRLAGTPRLAAISQIPLSLFMIAYTFFGLWLLATPRA
ncbi:MAG: hypothetical protein AAGI13_10565, partial [Pseudomonadota bacterium]